MIINTVITRFLHLQDYADCWQAMKNFTDHRDANTLDEFWIVEHPPVFTLGQNSKPEHILDTGTIPLIQSDRGGQVTYHGPGQLIIYVLVDLKRKQLNVRELVSALENAVIQLLASYSIHAKAKCEAPGVYVNDQKICSVGLRIRRGCSYHGLALNIQMDLLPFSRIHPCGYRELKMTQLSELTGPEEINRVSHQLLDYLAANLGYTTQLIKTEQLYGPENT
jgi:lipoyl(octanoyl) transferase